MVTVSFLGLCVLYDVCARLIFFSSAAVTIGFNTVPYSVFEDAGSVNVSISILNGTLARSVVVTLSTVSGGTSTGEYCINTHHAS